MIWEDFYLHSKTTYEEVKILQMKLHLNILFSLIIFCLGNSGICTVLISLNLFNPYLGARTASVSPVLEKSRR